MLRYMAFKKRQINPMQLPVQLNVKVPLQLREDLSVTADENQLSLNELVNTAIMKGLRTELTELGKRATKDGGATR